VKVPAVAAGGGAPAQEAMRGAREAAPASRNASLRERGVGGLKDISGVLSCAVYDLCCL
jgi:hypothetical protein